VAPKTIYVRANPDPNPIDLVYDIELLLRKVREEVQDLFYYLDINLSFPKDMAQSIDDLEFDALFEQTFFRSKSETNLDHIVFDEERFQSLILQAVNPAQNILQIPKPPREMAARFAPFVLPAQLHDFPHNYSQRIKRYDVEGNVSTQKHLYWFNDFVDLELVDHADVKMRMFA
jgi:hypothetical protein